MRHERRVGAHAVVLPVADHHAAVESQVAGASSGHDLDLGRQEVLFLDAVLLSQQLKRERLDGLLLFFFTSRSLDILGRIAVHCRFPGSLGGAHQASSARAGQSSGPSVRARTAARLGAVAAPASAGQRAVAHEDVQVLALHHLVGLLRHLLAGQVDQQVGDAEHRIVRVVAHLDVHHGAVFLRDHAVQRQRQRDPLVVLDAAVIMRIEQREPVRLVQRVLLEVEARAVDVRAQDVEPLLQRLLPEMRQDERLAVRLRPHLVAGLERAPFAHRLVKRQVAVLFRQRDGRSRALALGLVVRDEVDVLGSQMLQRLEVGFVVFLPCHVAFHVMRPFAAVFLFRPIIAKPSASETPKAQSPANRKQAGANPKVTVR